MFAKTMMRMWCPLLEYQKAPCITDQREHILYQENTFYMEMSTSRVPEGAGCATRHLHSFHCLLFYPCFGSELCTTMPCRICMYVCMYVCVYV